MERKNIFQLVEENYDINAEIKKINKLFVYENYFKNAYTSEYTLKQLTDAIFSKWEFAGTCLNSDEFLKKANAEIDIYGRNSAEDKIKNNLEALENFLFLVINHLGALKIGYKNPDNFKKFIKLVRTLETKMGLVNKEINGQMLLYPLNAPLEQVINIVEDKDVDWELIRYTRENLSLAEKRKSLAFLATNLYMEKDSEETDTTIKLLMGKTTNVLNNLHIRHNNVTGKWENAALVDITDKDAADLCDYAFNNMLNIVLLREQKKYEATYESFNEKQKQAKNKS